MTPPDDSIIIEPVDLKIVEANERTITASGEGRDELRQSSRHDRRRSPDQPRLEGMQRCLEEKALVYLMVHRRLEARTIPR
jgi:hypothetical protein